MDGQKEDFIRNFITLIIIVLVITIIFSSASLILNKKIDLNETTNDQKNIVESQLFNEPDNQTSNYVKPINDNSFQKTDINLSLNENYNNLLISCSDEICFQALKDLSGGSN